MISDAMSTLLHVSLKGKILWTEPLPGVNQEGIAVDDTRTFFVAQDSGGVLVLRRVAHRNDSAN
jgi:hypothetical protein